MSIEEHMLWTLLSMAFIFTAFSLWVFFCLWLLKRNGWIDPKTDKFITEEAKK